MGARSGRRQYRQSLYWRVHWDSAKPRIAAALRSLGSVLSDAAGMAMQAARSDVHLARTIAGAHLERSGSGHAPDHGLARRVAALHRQSLLHGWPSAPL